MKKTVADSPVFLTKPLTKNESRTKIPKEYYLLRDDVFEFLGIYTQASAKQLSLVEETTEA